MTSVVRAQAGLVPLSPGATKQRRPAPFTCILHARRSSLRKQVSAQAKQDSEQGSLQLPTILKLANGVTNTAANLIPSSVPRPVAKLGVVGVSSLVALWLFGKVISTFFTIAAVAGAIFLFVKSKGSLETTDNSQDNAADDPVASARRIMDKYK